MTRVLDYDLEEFLAAHLTPEGRKRALTEAVEQGFIDENEHPHYLVEAYSYRMERKEYNLALPLLKRRMDEKDPENRESFLAFYKEARMFDQAAEIYVAMRDVESAVKMYLKAGNRKAAELLDPSLVEDETDLIRRYERQNKLVEASSLLEKRVKRFQENGQREQELAAKRELWRLSEKAGFSTKAIELAKEFGDKEASRAYRRHRRMVLQKS